jgi:hypothetical protein
MIAGVDGSMFSDFSTLAVENTKTTFSFRKLGRDIAALTKLSSRNTQALVSAYVASEA